LTTHSLGPLSPFSSGGNNVWAEPGDSQALLPGRLIFPLSQSPQPLETKDIQEFLLAISDFLKSAELVSHGGKSK